MVYQCRINDIDAIRRDIPTWQLNNYTEALISDIWQCWNNFCRELLFSSCRGTITRDGQYAKRNVSDCSWKRLGYEAKQVISNQSIKTNGHLNFYVRKEPTWGDLDVFIKIIQQMTPQPSNANHLLTVFGSFSSIKQLQKLRNACAHKNIETVVDVHTLSTHYSFGRLKYMSDLAWCNPINSYEYAIEAWLYEMRRIADLATSTL